MCGLLLLLSTAARSQVIEFESKGLKYQALTRSSVTVMYAVMPNHLHEYGIIQVAVSNGSQGSYVIKPEDFTFVRSDGLVLRASPARTVVDMLSQKGRASDVINLVTGGEFNNPIGTALNPVLESAGNLGYTDVERVQNSDGDWEYVRTFDDTNVPTAFGSFPDVDWEKVPGDLFNLLGVGLRQAIDDGITGEPGPNALAELLKLLGLDTSSASGGSGPPSRHRRRRSRPTASAAASVSGGRRGSC